MRNLIYAVLMCLVLVGCGSKPTKPEVAFNGTLVSDLADKPNKSLMAIPEPKKKMEYGQDNGTQAQVVSYNNLRAYTIENNYRSLQKYVCNLFNDESVGEACEKDK